MGLLLFREGAFIRRSRGASNTITLQRGRLLDKRRLFEIGRQLLDHLRYVACVAGVERDRESGGRKKEKANRVVRSEERRVEWGGKEGEEGGGSGGGRRRGRERRVRGLDRRIRWLFS